MKCEVCQELLEEYLDAELAPEDRALLNQHLIGCADCAESFAALTAEQELFARYDREVEVPPFLWTRIAAHTVAEKTPARRGWRGLFAAPLVSVIALLLLAIAVGVVYVMSRQPASDPRLTQKEKPPSTPVAPGDEKQLVPLPKHESQPTLANSNSKPRLRTSTVTTRATSDQSDVLSSDLAYLDLDDQETAQHIEQSQILLRSIKNVAISDGDDEEIDVSYDKALSRRLLNENVVLRRDAEMKAKFPTKTLLADLEPFLIDIANLPDRARPEDVRAIKERVQKTEIVAALLDYQERGTNNR